MLQLLRKITSLRTRLPLVYSVILIILVPCTLIANTWWNLYAFDRDMNYGVRDQALAVEKTLSVLFKGQSLDNVSILNQLKMVKEAVPQVTNITILKPDNQGKFVIQATSNESPGSGDENLMLNQLAWAQNESFFIKTYDPMTKQNLWVVVSPLQNTNNQNIGLLNLKVKTQQIDSVISRTVRDSIIIMIVSVIAVLLLLVNHLHFFEQSLVVEKLKEIDKLKDDFISVASHELRTPLTAIKGCISMVKEDYKTMIPKEVDDLFSMMDISVARLNDLVTNLLNVSRIEQNRLDFTLAPLDVGLVIHEVVMQLQFNAKDKGLNLKHLTADTPLIALANKDRLIEVMTNIIGNAVKYTQKGSVTVSHTIEKNTVVVRVQDTGIGIAPEDKEKLFQKFSRISSDKTKDIPGTGLGLWITKELVERMKGKIYVDSIIGQGTVFTVVLQTAA